MKLNKILSITLAVLLVPVASFAQDNYIVGLSGTDLDKASESPESTLGIPYWGKQGVFIYAKATETITDGHWVFLDESNQLTLADTTESGTEQMRVCVSATDLSTTTP